MIRYELSILKRHSLDFIFDCIAGISEVDFVIVGKGANRIFEYQQLFIIDFDSKDDTLLRLAVTKFYVKYKRIKIKYEHGDPYELDDKLAVSCMRENHSTWSYK